MPIALALGALYNAWDNTTNSGSGYGAGLGRFLAWVPIRIPTQTRCCRPAAAMTPLRRQLHRHQQGAGRLDLAGRGTQPVPTNLTESIARSRYDIYSADARPTRLTVATLVPGCHLPHQAEP